MKRLAILCSGDVPAFDSKRLETNQIPGNKREPGNKPNFKATVR